MIPLVAFPAVVLAVTLFQLPVNVSLIAVISILKCRLKSYVRLKLCFATPIHDAILLIVAPSYKIEITIMWQCLQHSNPMHSFEINT